jgi:hypothetical protein
LTEESGDLFGERRPPLGVTDEVGWGTRQSSYRAEESAKRGRNPSNAQLRDRDRQTKTRSRRRCYVGRLLIAAAQKYRDKGT